MQALDFYLSSAVKHCNSPVFALGFAPLPKQRMEGEAVGEAVAVIVLAGVSAVVVAPTLAALVAGGRQEGDIDLRKYYGWDCGRAFKFQR